MEKLHGVWPPMITVFDENGKFDEAGQRKHINWLIENGVHGIIPCGSTGEFIALSDEERKRVVEVTVDEVNGRVKVYAHTAHYRTDKTIELSLHAQEVGADGVMIVSPYYLPRNREEVKNHYRKIREAIDIPIMLYNNPHFSHFDMTPEFIAELYKEGIISSVKEGEGEQRRTQDLLYLTDGGLSIFYGFDVTVVEALMMGADGWVAGTANLIPRHAVKVYELAKAGKYDEAKELWWETRKFIDLCTQPWKGEGAPWLAILKEGLNMIGQTGGSLLPPTMPLDDEMRAKLRTVLTELGYM